MTSRHDLDIQTARTVAGLLRVSPPGADGVRVDAIDLDAIDLDAIDPDATPGLPDRGERSRDWARAEVARLGPLLAEHQQRLFALARVGGRQRVLVVLQAMDCGGKDGTIKNVCAAMNPMGLRITAFGPPTERERAHPFLWRIRQALPPPGFVGVFNRSHYEDVLAARVRGIVPEAIWRPRYREIVDFEQALVDSGTTIIKIMLHISAEEQRRRLLARLDDPAKWWKFDPGDLDDRQLWGEFTRAYDDALTACGTSAAPWYVVPANHKWYRDWAVTQVVLARFDEMGLRYPPVPFDVAEQRRRLTGE